VARCGAQVGLPKVKADKPPRAVTLPGEDSQCAPPQNPGPHASAPVTLLWRLTHEHAVRRTKWDIHKTQKQNFAAIGLARYTASVLPLACSKWDVRECAD
jgi:hypothetical protein